MNPFEATTIVKVTPGKHSRYIADGANRSSTGFVTSGYGGAHFSTKLKLYLNYLKLEKPGLHYIKRHLDDQVYMTVKWSIFDIEDYVTSPTIMSHSKAKFNYTTNYDLEIDHKIARSQNISLNFRIYATSNEGQIFLSENFVRVDNLFEIANQKKEHQVEFRNSVFSGSNDVVAYLDIWYKFICKQKTLKALIPNGDKGKDKGSANKITDLIGSEFSKRSTNAIDIHVTDSEYDHFADNLWLVLNRNKVLKTTQSDIGLELQERVRWLRFEANWKQTLQENAILHGKNPEEVIWRQWREEDTAAVNLRKYENIPTKHYKSQLEITVVNLILLEGCRLLKNDDIKQFYVEYSFLGYEGPSMETPFSRPKLGAGEQIVFNFKKKFPFHIEKNPENCKQLINLIQNDGKIQFLIISEPIVNPLYPIQTCQQVGITEVSINDLIQFQNNSDVDEYEVIDSNNHIVVLGFLTLKFKGMLAMRRMALELLAPKGYKLIM